MDKNDPTGRIRTALHRGAAVLVSTLVVFLGAPLSHAVAAPSNVSISDVTVTEGASGSTVIARFTVSMDVTAKKPTGVKWTTQNGTATAGSDYVASNGSANIKKGKTTAVIRVTVNGDDLYEGDETFTVHLTHARGASISDADGVGTITDDDPVPSVSIANASVLEGTGTTTPLSFDVTMSGLSASNVTVDYATSDGTAVQPADYTAASGTLTWPTGTSGTQQVTVNVVADALDESDTETFTVTMSNVTGGATLGKAIADGIILDDDLPTPPVPTGTTTTVKAIKRRLATIAQGTVTPAHTGLTMTVRWYKFSKKTHHWKLLATKTPTLGTAVDPDGDGTYASGYRAKFKRIRGRQKFVVNFAGDSDHLPVRHGCPSSMLRSLPILCLSSPISSLSCGRRDRKSVV